MHKCRLVNLVFSLCFLCIPATAARGQAPIKSSAPISIAESSTSTIAVNPNDSNLPAGMLELINASRLKYLEGSSLIKAGEAEKSRQLFNEAVDIILQSSWELTSTPALNRFFQDLIQRIKQEESLYLLGPVNNEIQIENAVVDDLDNMDLIAVTVNPSLANAPFADLADTKYEIPITINDMVVQSLDFYLNRGRKYFVDGLLRSGQYQPLIEKVFREESIPLELMYLAQVESFFQPHAVSKAQAKGIWQFTKGTAIRYGLKVTRDVDERSDPEKSTRAAARYLKDLFAIFKDWNLVLAAYNWGEGKVQRLIDSTGLKDFWQLVDLRRRLPEETKKHIPLIQASVLLARNPEKYGLPTNLYPPLKYTEVSVSKPIDLRAAAKVLSTTIDELKKLNPALRGNTTPANYPNFQLKVPADTDPNMHEQLNSLPAAKIAPVSEYGYHKVKSGETLTQIATLYSVSVKDLEKANRLSSKNMIRAGSVIKVPGRITVASNSGKTSISRGKTVKSKNRSSTLTSKAKKSTKHTSSK
jgi:membrane-bound lytic murein transglycosylase D